MAADDRRERDDADALRDIAGGGAAAMAAMRRLSERWRPRLLKFCIDRGLPRAEAEELAQEVFVAVFTHAHEFEPGRAVSAWLWSFARHRLIDAMRSAWRRHRVQPDDDEGTDGLPAAAHALAGPAGPPAQAADDCVQRGLQAFAREEPEAALVVRLRDLEGWDVPQVAQFLRRTEGATRQFLHVTRRKLKPFLEPCLELLPA